ECHLRTRDSARCVKFGEERGLAVEAVGREPVSCRNSLLIRENNRESATNAGSCRWGRTQNRRHNRALAARFPMDETGIFNGRIREVVDLIWEKWISYQLSGRVSVHPSHAWQPPAGCDLSSTATYAEEARSSGQVDDHGDRGGARGVLA